MARITSKRQVTIPKAIADRYGIQPGDDVEFLPAGDAIRMHRRAIRPVSIDRTTRVGLFDRATERQERRQAGRRAEPPGDRGWRREDLYGRAGAR